MTNQFPFEALLGNFCFLKTKPAQQRDVEVRQILVKDF